MSPVVTAVITGVVTVVVALLGCRIALAKLAREQRQAAEAAEDARQDKGRVEREARENALISAITRGAEAQAKTAVILDAVKDYLSSMRRSEERILRALTALLDSRDAPDRQSPEPEIPSGRTIHSQEETHQ